VDGKQELSEFSPARALALQAGLGRGSRNRSEKEQILQESGLCGRRGATFRPSRFSTSWFQSIFVPQSATRIGSRRQKTS
jgi:hypothetical protein